MYGKYYIIEKQTGDIAWGISQMNHFYQRHIVVNSIILQEQLDTGFLHEYLFDYVFLLVCFH